MGRPVSASVVAWRRSSSVSSSVRRCACAAPNQCGGEQGEHHQAENEDDVIVACVARIGGVGRGAAQREQAPFLGLDPAERGEEGDDLAAFRAGAHLADRLGAATRGLERDQPVDGAGKSVQPSLGRDQIALLPDIVAGRALQRAQQLEAVAAALEIGLEEVAVAGEQIAALAAHHLVDRGFEAGGGQQHVERMDLQRLRLPPLRRRHGKR